MDDLDHARFCWGEMVAGLITHCHSVVDFLAALERHDTVKPQWSTMWQPISRLDHSGYSRADLPPRIGPRSVNAFQTDMRRSGNG